MRAGINWILVLIIGVMFPGAGRCQDIKVIEQAGKSIESFKETTIVFQTDNGKEANVYQLLSESSAFASGPGGTASAYGVNTKFICTAPSKIVVPGGYHNFIVNNQALFGAQFQVRAEGGTQYWFVAPARPGRFIAGMPLVILGTAAAAVGFGLGEPIIGIVGLGAGAGGVVLALSSSAKARLIRTESQQ